MDNPTNFSNSKRPCSQQLRWHGKSGGFSFLPRRFKELERMTMSLKSIPEAVSLLVVFIFLLEF